MDLRTILGVLVVQGIVHLSQTHHFFLQFCDLTPQHFIFLVQTTVERCGHDPRTFSIHLTHQYLRVCLMHVTAPSAPVAFSVQKIFADIVTDKFVGWLTWNVLGSAAVLGKYSGGLEHRLLLLGEMHEFALHTITHVVLVILADRGFYILRDCCGLGMEIAAVVATCADAPLKIATWWTIFWHCDGLPDDACS